MKLLILGSILLLFTYDICTRYCERSQKRRSGLSDFFYLFGIILSFILIFIQNQYLSYSKNMMLGTLIIFCIYEWSIWFIVRNKLKIEYDKFIDIISFIMLMFILPFLSLTILVGYVLGHPF